MRSVLFDIGNRFQKHFILSKFTGTDHGTDAEEFLVHNASCADVLMPDFTVADNTSRQTDIFTGGMDLNVSDSSAATNHLRVFLRDERRSRAEIRGTDYCPNRPE